MHSDMKKSIYLAVAALLGRADPVLAADGQHRPRPLLLSGKRPAAAGHLGPGVPGHGGAGGAGRSVCALQEEVRFAAAFGGGGRVPLL